MVFTEYNKNGVIYTAAPNISAKHAFSTRFGGVSCGIYESLNLSFSCGDNVNSVMENYKIFADALGIAPCEFVFSKQVHKDTVWVCTESDRSTLPPSIPYEADGLITDIVRLPLMVFSADCTPILLHDPVRGAVGAVHAGWRGTVMNIVGKTVKKMQSEFGCKPENINAAIGPCISFCCFETGYEVYESVFTLLGADTEHFALKKPDGKYMIDLKGINKLLLNRVGVNSVSVSDECTKCSSDKYWSHRATNGRRGTQCSCIVL